VCVLTENDCIILHKLAERTKLHLSDKEEEEICRRIKSIQRFFSQLDEVSVEDVKPLYHVLEVSGKSRADEPVSFPVDEIKRSLEGRFKDDYIVSPWKGGYE
jgi:aspartyl/glutamyl-tRNA(Asn/Gln) amidotransferase C subunit